jgi:hypothetical protein
VRQDLAARPHVAHRFMKVGSWWRESRKACGLCSRMPPASCRGALCAMSPKSSRARRSSAARRASGSGSGRGSARRAPLHEGRVLVEGEQEGLWIVLENAPGLVQGGTLCDVSEEQTCARAAGSGHLAVLQWARANGCPWDERRTRQRAAEGCHLEVLQWMDAAYGCSPPNPRGTRPGLSPARGRCSPNTIPDPRRQVKKKTMGENGVIQKGAFHTLLELSVSP